MKLKMIVQTDLRKSDIFEPENLEKDLLGELVKVKSGVYDNCFYATITKVEITKR